jgi:hypothetical protein
LQRHRMFPSKVSVSFSSPGSATVNSRATTFPVT